MKKILLLFLSDVKTKNLNDKIVISEAHYENVEGENTQTTNESAVRYMFKRVQLDKIFIFASKKVQEEIPGYIGEDRKPRTHLAFSLERFKKFLPTADCFIFNYDENGSGNENLQSVAEMAHHIQKFSADDNITLHVDLSGGMRHVNMLMLELTRLLEYSGLTVGKILYSNYNAKTKTGKIEELQNVYDLFQLIASVEEFVNFGSVYALEKYYSGRKISPPLEKLKNAMKNFAEAIKLCHYGQFSETIIKLHDAINDFNKHEPANVEDILMARLIERIHDNYHDLIAIREKDDVRVIRWCLDNDYLQQSLTLYTERIPEYLGEKGFITQTAEEEKNLLELLNKDSIGRERWFYLFSDIKPKNNFLGNGKKEYTKAVKEAAKKIIKEKNFDFDVWLKDLNEKLAPLNLHFADEKNLRLQFETLTEIFNDPSMLCDLSAPKLDSIRPIINACSNDFADKTTEFERRKILIQFLNNKLSVNNVSKYFFDNGFLKFVKDFPRAQKIYELFVEKNFSVCIPIENFLRIADKYFRIKNERNRCNHAHKKIGEFKTAEELRKFINGALDDLKELLPVH